MGHQTKEERSRVSSDVSLYTMQECDSTGVRQHYVLERETKLGLGVSLSKATWKTCESDQPGEIETATELGL